MLITLTQTLTELEKTFLLHSLTKADAILVNALTAPMALTAPVFPVASYVRQLDLAKLGGQCHDGWISINDAEWVELTCQHDKVITW